MDIGKRLAPIIAVLAMLLPVAAFALGFGNITMKSALNQPLDAEIELLSVQKGDLENLKIRLGSLEDFARVGADRAYFLTQIKFSLAQKPDGTSYVRLSSSERVTEPFLDFVVEARWPRGRILREFTVLVDPPVLSDEAPAPIRQAAVQTTPAAATTTTRITRQAPIRERAMPSSVTSHDGVLSYGPVQPNETLWVIASRMRPDESVSVNQMMLALVRDNPQAFYNGNVNQLKAGYVLRIEDPAAVTALSVAQANAEVEHQRAEWQARKSGRPLRQVAASETEAVGPDAGEGGDAGGQARLKLVAPGSEGAGSGTGDGDVDRLRQDLVLAAEALDANRQETDELKTRLSQMEEQLAAMQRLIMLKDDEMLSLQKQLGGEVEEPAVPEAVSEQEMLEAEVVEGTELAVEGDAEPSALEIASTEETQEPQEELKPLVPAPVAEAPAPEPGLLESPLLMYGGIGVLVLAIVGWIMARRRKMQEGFQESILNVGDEGAAGTTNSGMAQSAGGESSMVSDFAMSEISEMNGAQTNASDVDPVSEADVYLAYGRHQQAEEIIRAALEDAPERNELKLKLLEVFFAAKNSEAFELQAQELHDALGDETDPLWVKAVTMGSQLCPANPLFGGAVHALQEELEGGAPAADEDLLDFDFDLDTPTMEDTKVKADADDFALDDAERRERTEATTSTTLDTGLDFDVSTLDFNLDQRDDEMKEEGVASSDDNALDFDMKALDKAVAAPEAETEVASEEARKATDDLGFDKSTTDVDDSVLAFSSDEMEPSKQSGSMESEKSDFTVDLSAEELALDNNEVIKFDSPAEAVDSSEFDIALDEVIENDALIVEDGVESTEAKQPDTGKDKATGDEPLLGESLEDELLSDDMFGEVDEIGTKLDLAKAYVDMGDGDGARSILDEVLEEGDDTQKQQAKDLLEQIS
ncbi:hypothetical protein MNBD_GAMMA20-2163 [hydrothermal vent metagenome]|uniref:FimV N-terminal domain-containing protein n=1 Tax=hydrothermal vent metagenome TaxID=652676 RepID=A0A3B1AF79_9ZZZZ